MLRAIIVDDEILVRATLEKMVDWAAEGFQLAGCYANGQAALEAMERCPADLVFTDIKMPVCSGLEFIGAAPGAGAGASPPAHSAARASRTSSSMRAGTISCLST